MGQALEERKLDVKQIMNRIYAGVRGVVSGTTTADYADNTFFIGPFTAGSGDEFQDFQSITHGGTLFLSVLNVDATNSLQVDIFETPNPDAIWVSPTNNQWHRIEGLNGVGLPGPAGLLSGEKLAIRGISFASSYVIALKDGTGGGAGPSDFIVSWEFKA